MGSSNLKLFQTIALLMIISTVFSPIIGVYCLMEHPKDDLMINNPVMPKVVDKIFIENNLLFVDEEKEVTVFNIDNPQKPIKKGTIAYGKNFPELFVYQNLFIHYYIFPDFPNDESFIRFYDISKPSNPKYIIEKEFSIGNSIQRCVTMTEMNGNLLFHELMMNHTEINQLLLNVNNFSSSKQVIDLQSMIPEEIKGCELFVSNDQLYYIFINENNTLGMATYNIDSSYQLHEEMIVRSNFTLQVHSYDPGWFYLDGDRLYYFDLYNSSSSSTSLHVFDFSDGENLTEIGSFSDENNWHPWLIEDSMMYCLKESLFSIINLTDISNTELITTYENENSNLHLTRIAKKDNYFYIGQTSLSYTDCLLVLKMDSSLEIDLIKSFGTMLIEPQTRFLLILISGIVGGIAVLTMIIVLPILLVRKKKRMLKEKLKNQEE
ncbi:MAG: hypothetical protein ACFFDW_06620 [Candidatus Thorarchaeota archaeon]